MFTPPTFIDGLYDYLPLLTKSPLCELPPQAKGEKIAVIGAGPSGLLIGYELLKMGLKPIIYEATNRIGGRFYTKHFQEIIEENPPYAEFGAMRIPKSSVIFFHYAKILGLKCHFKFPSPGLIDSLIYYRNKLYDFSPTKPLPPQFSLIKTLWELFSDSLVHPIHEEWQKGNLDKVRLLWQLYIDQYKDKSFYEVLRERSPIITAGQVNIFGTLGIGSGGFNSIFQVGFLEILRILINTYILNLSYVYQGSSQFTDKLYQHEVETSEGLTSLKASQAVKLNSPVVLFDYNLQTQRPIIVVKPLDQASYREEFAAVVFTGSMNAAHLINLSENTTSGKYIFTASVREAIRSSLGIASSKTFICTQDKFWLKHKFPRCILTDAVTKTSFFLDYPHTKRGVVCMSYSWGTDALKMHAVDPKDRLVIFKRVIQEISPEINKYLIPLNDEILCMDWINQKFQNGAFKLLPPGYDAKQKKLYFQFQSVLTKDDKGVYLAGDGVSWSGGWVEGALYTGINAVFAVAKHLKAKIPAGSPLEQNKDLFHY